MCTNLEEKGEGWGKQMKSYLSGDELVTPENDTGGSWLAKWRFISRRAKETSKISVRARETDTHPGSGEESPID